MFLNATMLAGIAGATVPLVLHLLSRARCARIRWGAMMFLDLEESARRHFRSSRARELLLLLVRMGIVATLRSRWRDRCSAPVRAFPRRALPSRLRSS